MASSSSQFNCLQSEEHLKQAKKGTDILTVMASSSQFNSLQSEEHLKQAKKGPDILTVNDDETIIDVETLLRSIMVESVDDPEIPSRCETVRSLIYSLNEDISVLPDIHDRVCIYKISEKYRDLKKDAYTPRVVSIGPIHHGKDSLKTMESYKVRCMKTLLQKCRMEIENLVSRVAKVESFVRSYYEDTSKFNSEEFCKMIVLDGVFVVQLLSKTLIQHMREPGDVLFENRWMASDLLHDMLLLENQLPLPFIIGLYEFLCGHDFMPQVSLISLQDLLFKYFEGVGITKRLKGVKMIGDYDSSRHLIDFLVTIHRPSDRPQRTSRKGKFEYTRSASELQEAGVRFDRVYGELFKVSFDKRVGLLEIPQLTVNDTTETFFRNLLAFEQCGHYEKHITSYVIFMDSLINTAEDVELLVGCEIIDNMLGENQLVADLFNSLYKEVIKDQGDFYFARICNDLDDYSRDSFHAWKSKWFKWKLILKNNYFSNPWSVISFIAAAIVIVLTTIQTVCSILGL